MALANITGQENFELHAIEGIPVEKPNYHEQFGRAQSPPPAPVETVSPYHRRNKSARARANEPEEIFLPRATPMKKRPNTSKPTKPSIKESPYTVKKNNFVARPRTSKERQQSAANAKPVSARPQQNGGSSRPQTSKQSSRRVQAAWRPGGSATVTPRDSPREATREASRLPTKRPTTSKERGNGVNQQAGMRRPGTSKPASRPVTSRPGNKRNPPAPRDPRLKVRAFRPIRSEYSKEAMNKHFQRHMYFKNHILHRNKVIRPPTPEEEEEESDQYSSLFESSSEESDSSELLRSPAPSITPSPPPEEERHTPMFADENFGEITTAPTPAPEPLFKELEDVDESFLPPSAMYKIDKEASMSSESDNENPILIVKDGKAGMYKKKKTGEYQLIDEKKRKKKLQNKIKEKQKAKELKEIQEKLEKEEKEREQKEQKEKEKKEKKEQERLEKKEKKRQEKKERKEKEREERREIKEKEKQEKKEQKEKERQEKKEKKEKEREERLARGEVVADDDDDDDNDDDVSSLSESSDVTTDDDDDDDDDDDGIDDNDDDDHHDQSVIETDDNISEKPPSREIFYIDYENMMTDDEENDADDEDGAINSNTARRQGDESSDDSDSEIDEPKILTTVTDENDNDDNNNKKDESTATTNEGDVSSSQKINGDDESNETNEKAMLEPISLNEKYIKGESENEDNGSTHEMDSKVISEDSDDTDGDDKKEKEPKTLIEKYSNLRHDTPADFDAKRQYDSGSDLDEFGRRRDRARPSSSMYDYLPPLKPDPVIDNDDVNNCKIRLLRDAVTIREALLKNEGLELETSVELIISHNCDNRRWLRKLYRDEYLQSLLLDLRKTLPSDVASVISYMMIPRCEFDAMHLWDALKGLHKDPEVLCEILCTRNNQEMKAIRESYFMRYNEELMDHLEDETIGVFQRMLMKLALGERDEEEVYNKPECAKEARALHAVSLNETFHRKNGISKDVDVKIQLITDVKGEMLYKRLIDVFSRCPIEKLRLILTEYRKFKGNEMDKDIVSALSGDFCRCIVTLMHYISNPPNYFVEKLHNTHFKGADDDKGLCRIIISRSERDLEMIKQLFLLRYNMELFDYISQVCHGSLKGLVLRIILGQITPNSKFQYDLPPLFPTDAELQLQQRLTLPMAVELVLRKTKVVSRMIKLLNMRRERMNEDLTSSEESADELEVEPEQDQPEPDEDEGPAPLDSDEEQERAEKEAQRELRNGLKNISFASDVVMLDDGGHKSVFHDVKFAAASRGILKNTDAGDSDEEGDEEKEMDLEDEIGQNKPAGPKMTQLNGPVLDPTFQGREERKGKNKNKKAFRGTIKGVDMSYFNALKDAQAIGKAMLQKNRNVEGILQFLATRNNAQRQLIIREFFRRYRRDLVDDLRTLAPHHEEITLALLLSSEIYASAALFAAFEDDDRTITIDGLIETLCSRQNDEIAIIKRAFNGIFSLDLHDEISKVTNGPFCDLLCTIADCQRDEGDIVDENLAKKDAQALYESVIKSRNMRDFGIFVEIFGTRTFPHIEIVCDNFAKIARLDILEILDEVLEREFLEGVTAIICNVRDPAMYFCERIYRSACYEDTDISMLIRCVVSRAEIDLQLIKHAFRQTYGRSIYNLIDKDTDFKSKRILLDVVKK